MMVKWWRAAAAVVVLSVVLTGCANGGNSMEPPTGDELFAEAEQHYFDYRAVTNDIQALIFEGPWEVPPGSYGMEPGSSGCPDGSYKFDLFRSTDVDLGELERLRGDVREFLVDAGYEVEGMELGEGESHSIDWIVREQGDFSLLMVTFIANGAVSVSAKTTCWPGDEYELGDLLFGGVYLSEGYFPREESPSDPLFFGITPGEPAFRGTPSPTPTPTVAP